MNPSDVLSHLPSVGQVVMPLVYTLQYLARKLSIQLRVLDGVDAYPILSEIVPQLPRAETGNVISIAIKALPVPDDTVSWEQNKFRWRTVKQAPLLKV
jgi:hypothetical protein